MKAAPYLEGLQPVSSQAKLPELLECAGRKVRRIL